MADYWYDASGNLVIPLQTTIGGVISSLTTPPSLAAAVKRDGSVINLGVGTPFANSSLSVFKAGVGYLYTLAAADITANSLQGGVLTFSTDDADVDYKNADDEAVWQVSVDSSWITQIADILADTSALIPGTTPARLTPYDPTSLTIGIIYGADYTATSSLGRLEIPNTVTALNIATAGGTLTFTVRLANEKAGSGKVFSAATVTAMDSDTAYVSLVDPTETRAIQPGMAAIWSLMHETAGGLITPLNGGIYRVIDSAPPT